VHPDLVALLALQDEDTAVAVLEARRRELDARETALDQERVSAESAIARARLAAEAEDKKRRELGIKVQEHRALHDRHLAALDAVRKDREATAAMAQIEITRRVLAQEESEMQTLATRIVDLNQAAELEQLSLAELAERQGTQRAEIAVARSAVDAELGTARAQRNETASRVGRPLLQKYERIRGRENSNALYALRGSACGRCNTAIPLQRRNVMAAGRSVEVCEGCGVLLYAAV
jgi:predicted  nucleic acid-binding Zn-ribbon protein